MVTESGPERIKSQEIRSDRRRTGSQLEKQVACIGTGKHGWLDFDMKDEAKADLFLRGVWKATEFLRKFNWAKYKHISNQKSDWVG